MRGTRPNKDLQWMPDSALSLDAKADADPYQVQSPWGAIAGFFLVQCFGFVTLQDFRMFFNIALHGSDELSVFDATGPVERVLLPLWGGVWLFTFVACQTDIFKRIAAFGKDRGIAFFLQALRAPSEAAKAGLAVLFGLICLSFVCGHYPFPCRPISTMVSILFGIFGWFISSLLAWALRRAPTERQPEQTGNTAGAIMGFLVGVIFFGLACFVQPGLFYFHGMLGLGVMTLISCKYLFKKGKSTGISNRGVHSISGSCASADSRNE